MKKITFFIAVMAITFTQAQVSLVKDINPGAGNGFSTPFVETDLRIDYNGELLFTADYKLWKSDGTPIGTTKVNDIYTTFGGFPISFFHSQIDNKVYLSATDNSLNYTSELWQTDGTNTGTYQLKDINTYVYQGNSVGSTPFAYADFNNDIYFSAFTTTGGRELYKTDGTTAGTILVKDIVSGNGWSVPHSFMVYNNQLFFTATSSSANNLNNGNRELWVTDGTSVGTQQITEINPGSANANPLELTLFDEKIFFTADNGVNGRELWSTNGTASGTVMYDDINVGSPSSSPSNLTVFNGELYFTADNGASGIELYKINSFGLVVIVSDINSGSGDSNPSNLTVFNDRLYFSADNGTDGNELWVTYDSNSTERATTTTMIKDINSTASSSPINLTIYNNKLYFSADNGASGRELWVTDGTETGTVMVDDINSSGASFPNGFVVSNNLLFFSASDGTTGRELYTYQDPTLTINNLELENSISLYPNPTHTFFSLESTSEIAELSIYNVQGKLVKSFENNQTIFSIEELTAGLYFLNIKTDDGSATKKIIKL